MDEVVNKELDRIFIVEMKLATAIREQITNDYKTGKFTKYELSGRLNLSQIQLTSMLTRKTWTLRYAILIASKLGYNVETFELGTT